LSVCGAKKKIASVVDVLSLQLANIC